MASSLCYKMITSPDSLLDLRSYIKFASDSQTQLCRSNYLDAFVQVRQEESLSVQIAFSVQQRKLGIFTSFHLYLLLWCSQLFTGAILKTPLIKPTLLLISRTKTETVGLCTSPFRAWRLGNGKQPRGDIWRRLFKLGGGKGFYKERVTQGRWKEARESYLHVEARWLYIKHQSFRLENAERIKKYFTQSPNFFLDSSAFIYTHAPFEFDWTSSTLGRPPTSRTKTLGDKFTFDLHRFSF